MYVLFGVAIIDIFSGFAYIQSLIYLFIQLTSFEHLPESNSREENVSYCSQGMTLALLWDTHIYISRRSFLSNTCAYSTHVFMIWIKYAFIPTVNEVCSLYQDLSGANMSFINRFPNGGSSLKVLNEPHLIMFCYSSNILYNYICYFMSSTDTAVI